MNRVLSASAVALALLAGSLLHDDARAQSQVQGGAASSYASDAYSSDRYATPNRSAPAQGSPRMRGRMLTWSGKTDVAAPRVSAAPAPAPSGDLRGVMGATAALQRPDRYGSGPAGPARYDDARSALPRTDVQRFQTVDFPTRRMDPPRFAPRPAPAQPAPAYAEAPRIRQTQAAAPPPAPRPDYPAPPIRVAFRSLESRPDHGRVDAPSAPAAPTSIYDPPASPSQPVATPRVSPATSMKSAQMAPPAARTSGGQGVRFYSVHRQYGLTPDAAPIPPQFFAETPDLSASAGPDPLRRTVAGSAGLSARAARVASSTAQPDPATSQP